MRARTAIQGTAFVALVFFVLPRGAVSLGEQLGWPRWEDRAAEALGGALVAAGIGVMLYCSRLFQRVGRGTPVPFEPPTELVVEGLYRWSRNPIYVADVAVLLGLFLMEGSLSLLAYALLFTAFLHAAIVLWEEPGLVRRFGEPYEAYRRSVPRWLGPRASA